MSALITLFRAYLIAALALALNACATPYGNAGVAGYGPISGVASAQQALMGQQGGMMGMPFGNAGWQYAGSGFDPAMQPMIAAQKARNTVYAVSPNVTVTHPPMFQPSAGAPVAGTAPQVGAPSGYATNAALQAVAGRVHRNAEEMNRAIEALRRRQRR